MLILETNNCYHETLLPEIAVINSFTAFCDLFGQTYKSDDKASIIEEHLPCIKRGRDRSIISFEELLFLQSCAK